MQEASMLTLKVLVITMHWDTFKQDTYRTVGRHRRSRVTEVRASTASPIPDQKGFKLQ